LAPSVTASLLPGTPALPTLRPSTNLDSQVPSANSTNNQKNVRVTPFRLSYNLTDTGEPNEFEFAFAGDVALGHLESFLVDQFSNTFDVQIESFEGMIIETGFNPVAIDFNATVTFSDASSFIPNAQEVDMLVEVAFLPPQVDVLIEEYGTLSMDMPFSTTQSIDFGSLTILRNDDLKLLRSEDAGRKTATEKALIVIVASLSVLLIMLLKLLYQSSKSLRRCPSSPSKFELIPIMPGYSYCDCRSNNLMQFKDETLSNVSKPSTRFKAKSTGSSLSSRSSSVVIRAV
jgi:hypothetical protein